jgi:DNA-binding MarR family transcriptional regulator
LAKLDLFSFVPFRLNRLAAEVSSALSSEYQQRYGLDIPEWRVLATLGFRNDACSAQYIAHCTRTHKSTISRAVTALMKRQLVERVENADDRREFALRMTRKGTALYQELIPRLLRREQEILSCLSAQERRDFAVMLGKIEKSLDLVQTAKQAGIKEAYGGASIHPSFRGARQREPGISRFRVRRFASPRNDEALVSPPRHFTAVTTISTICGGSSSTPRQARIGGFWRSTHSSQARFISPLRFMSAI